MVEETRGNREIINQILNSTFNCRDAFDHRIMCPAGPEVIIGKIVNFKKVGFCSLYKHKYNRIRMLETMIIIFELITLLGGRTNALGHFMLLGLII